MISPRRTYIVPLRGRAPLALGARTLVMGILNVTPDSFADGGLYSDVDRAVERAHQMVEEGADILDVGGESTRPGALPIPEEDEARRVLPVIERLAPYLAVPISIDTYKAAVARAAVARGATIVNDVGNLQYDPDLAAAVAETGAALILMHNRGRSRDMYHTAVYADVLDEIASELEAGIARATDNGVRRDAIVVDPGLGFAKRAEHTYAALAGLDRLARLQCPILSGPSRKSFLSRPLGDRPAVERDWGTAAAVTSSILLGAHIVRVHNVRDMIDVVKVADQIRMGAAGAGSVSTS